MGKYFNSSIRLYSNPLLWIIFFYAIFTSALASPQFVATPLSSTLQMQLQNTGLWQADCPVKLEDLQLLSISYYDFSGQIHKDGTLIVNKSAAAATLSVFKALYAQKFPFTDIDTLIKYNGDWRQAETRNVSYGFRCSKNPSGYDPESKGTIITVNPIQNPAINRAFPPPTPKLWCKLLHRFCKHFVLDPKIEIFPNAGMFAVNRQLQIKGMVETIVPIFTQYGFTWSGTSTEFINWKQFIF